MFVGGTGSSAAIWLNSLARTNAPSSAEKLFGATTGKDDPAKPAASNTHFPTAPPVHLGIDALLALQDAGPAAQPAPTSLNAEPETESLDPSAAEQFLDYMQKSPEERLRDNILKALGVTEEDIANMSPDERMAIEKKIKDIVKETLVKTEPDAAPDRDEANADIAQQQLMLEAI
jgi:hypothetical protein